METNKMRNSFSVHYLSNNSAILVDDSPIGNNDYYVTEKGTICFCLKEK